METLQLYNQVRFFLFSFNNYLLLFVSAYVILIATVTMQLGPVLHESVNSYIVNTNSNQFKLLTLLQ
jgi:hypothetical protein